MKANLRARKQTSGNDEGVSPVIAVILMVAITVVLAATVYVWVSGFSSDEQGAENAQVRASGYDSDNNGASDFVRLTLVRGENAPYGLAATNLTVVAPDNSINEHVGDDGLTTNDFLCTAIDADAADNCNTNDEFGSSDEWEVGQSLYVPCQAAGQHQLELTLRSSVVLDDRVRCDEAAP